MLPVIVISDATAETEPRATRAVDARSTLRIILSPKRLTATGTDGSPKILEKNNSAIHY